MSSALLSVLLVCKKNTQTPWEIRQHIIYILISSHVRHFSDENQTEYPTLKNEIIASPYAKTTRTVFT
jgi:hypothetical protein